MSITALPTPPPDDEDARKAEAAQKRKEFLASIAGAKLRADELPRALLKSLPFAVATQQLIDILNGKHKVKSAAEAIRIAQIAAEIGRTEMGEGDGRQPVTPEERKQRLDEIQALAREVSERRAILEEQAAGVTVPVVEEPEAAEPESSQPLAG